MNDREQAGPRRIAHARTVAEAAAYRIDGRRVDRATFYAAACDPRRSAVVEACAGAGKTWVLVSRMLRALLDGAQPHEILAITFTRKAAGEMRERLDGWLTEFGSPSCPLARRIEALRERGLGQAEAAAAAPALAGLQERVLQSGRPVQISTFHGWFSQLLRAAPLERLGELGLRPDVEIVDDLADHRPAVFRRFHGAVLADAALLADYDALVLRRGRSQALAWLGNAWQQRTEIELADRAGTLDASVPPPADAWPAFAGLDHPCQRLRAPRVDGLLRSVTRALAAQPGAVPRQRAAALDTALALADHGACFTAVRSALFTLTGSLRKRLEAPGLDELVGHLDDIRRAVAQQQAHEEHRRMARLARCLLRELAAYKREHGLAEMADLEVGALALLRDSALAGWVQQRLDARVRHLLIDEFQDTSPLQWHALYAWLSGYAGAGGGASGQRPPAVFIVGDPKQSIYRFRRAEPRVFEVARAFVIEAFGGLLLDCDHTRRNTPELLAVLNRVFDGAQREGAFGGFRQHTTERGVAVDAGDADVADADVGGAAGVAGVAGAAAEAGRDDFAGAADQLRRPGEVAESGDENPFSVAREAGEAGQIVQADPAGGAGIRSPALLTSGAASSAVAGRTMVDSTADKAATADSATAESAFVVPPCRVATGVFALPLVPRTVPPDGDRGDREADDERWRDTLTVPRLQPVDVPRQREADAVAAAIAALLAAWPGLRPRDVQVLCRKRESLRLVAQSLAAQQLPVAAPEDAQLFDSREVRDVVALLDALSSMGNALALAQALRSPLFAASDDDLVAIATEARRQAAAFAADRGIAPGATVARGDWWRALQTLADASPALQRARHLLAQWSTAAQALPPHDLLDRIFEEGDMLARTLAAVPLARRQVAQAALQALLRESLALDGARYATPYRFVRALKRRRIALPPAAPGDAVQLLTVHGAKGLEAPVVFLMDAQPEEPKAATATLLVDWPVELAHPRRCAFVYAESQLPPSLEGLFEHELAARRREALNGLYVAITRARDALVVSATEPHGRAAAPSWWQRVCAAAGGAADQPAPRPPWLKAMPAAPCGAAADGGAIIKALPLWRSVASTPVVPNGPAPWRAGEAGAAMQVVRDGAAPYINADAGAVAGAGAGAGAGAEAGAEAEAEAEADAEASASATASASASAGDVDTSAAVAADSAAARLGQAVHRALEWLTRAGAADRDIGAASQAAAFEFGSDATRVARTVSAVLDSPACARFFDAASLLWAGNEVCVADDGEVLRIDRLVALPPARRPLHATPAGPVERHWWVLDYKLNRRPEALDAYRAQLRRYCRAVARLQPGEPVYGAFITGDGKLVELDDAC